MNGTFPAKRAEFFMNSEVGQAPHEFVVVDQATRFKDGQVSRDNVVDEYRQYRQSLGAHCAWWLDGSGYPTSTPEGVFAEEFLARNPQAEQIKAALAEFSKIEECAWARLMLAAIEYREESRRSD